MAKAATTTQTEETTMATCTASKICAYAVVDADTGEKFSSTSHEGLDNAIRQRNELAIKYGKEFCLEVWGIDDSANLVDLGIGRGDP